MMTLDRLRVNRRKKNFLDPLEAYLGCAAAEPCEVKAGRAWGKSVAAGLIIGQPL